MNDNQNQHLPMQLTPVGQVRSKIKTPIMLAGESDIELQERMEKIREYHRQVENNICELFIFSPMGGAARRHRRFFPYPGALLAPSDRPETAESAKSPSHGP